MTLARIGEFALNTKVFLGEHRYTTHDIEIVRYGKTETSGEYCYTIADFAFDEKDGVASLVGCGHRLTDALADGASAAEAICRLAEIGYGIIENTEDFRLGDMYDDFVAGRMKEAA